MVIILDTPYSLGDLSPETFPHVYVTNLLINGPAQTVTVMAEVGKMGQGYAWSGAPANTVFQLNLSGEALYPFFFQKPSSLDESLWDQVESLIYAEIQKAVPRYAGKLGSGLPEQTESAPSEGTIPAEQPSATDSGPEPSTTTEPASSTESAPTTTESSATTESTESAAPATNAST